MHYFINSHPRTGTTYLLNLLNVAVGADNVTRNHSPWALSGVFDSDIKQITIAREPVKPIASFMMYRAFDIGISLSDLVNVEPIEGHFTAYSWYLSRALQNTENVTIIDFQHLIDDSAYVVAGISNVYLTEDDVLLAQSTARSWERPENPSNVEQNKIRRNYQPVTKEPLYFEVLDYLTNHTSAEKDEALELYNAAISLNTTL